MLLKLRRLDNSQVAWRGKENLQQIDERSLKVIENKDVGLMYPVKLMKKQLVMPSTP